MVGDDYLNEMFGDFPEWKSDNIKIVEVKQWLYEYLMQYGYEIKNVVHLDIVAHYNTTTDKFPHYKDRLKNSTYRHCIESKFFVAEIGDISVMTQLGSLKYCQLEDIATLSTWQMSINVDSKYAGRLDLFIRSINKKQLPHFMAVEVKSSDIYT